MCLVACDYEFDKKVKFCEKIPVVGKLCTPSIDFEGKLILESLQTEAGIPVSGTVKQPYWSPQGEVVGAVLEDGTVVLLPQGSAGGAGEGVRDLLKPGAKLAAEGPGTITPVEGGQPHRALLAERIGENPGALRPMPLPADARR